MTYDVNDQIGTASGELPFDIVRRVEYSNLLANRANDGWANASRLLIHSSSLRYRSQFRLDLPFVVSSDGKTTQSGLGDVELRATYDAIPVPERGFVWGFSARAILPTGDTRTVGAGSWNLRPAIGAQYNGDGWSAAMEIRHTFNLWRDSDRNELTFTPIYEFDVTDTTWVIVQPYLSYRWSDRSWSAPLDVIIGKRFNDTWSASLTGLFLLSGHTDPNPGLELDIRYRF